MMKTAAALVLAALTLPAQADKLTVISFGGANKEAQTRAFYQPFRAAGKGSIEAGEFNGELARIRAMVETGQISWDVVELETPELVRACEEGLLEPLEWQKIGSKADFIPAAVSECGAGFFVWSTVLTWDAGRLKTGPTGWADFWDVQRFPGKRALRKSAKFTLEIALLADGVKREDIYKVLATPAGVDRAFRKLDRLKPSIQWWESGAQPLQWLVAGDVVMTSAFNGRISAAQQEGHNFKIVWDNAIYDVDSWAIVKGSKNRALAQQFIAFTEQPQNQKVFAGQIAYGPTNLNTARLLDPARLSLLPTAPANLAVSLPIDSRFWLEHGEDLEQRFNAWAAR